MGTLAGLALLGACGARTGLLVDGELGDGATTVNPQPPRDAGVLMPPMCGDEVPIGAIRGKIAHIDSRVAIDDVGNLYASRVNDDDSLSLVSFDPCLRPRWQVPIVGAKRLYTSPRVVVDGRGDVWVISPDRTLPAVWRFAADGSPKDLGVKLGSLLETWIGVPDEGGPIFVTGTWKDLALQRVDATGRLDSVAVKDDDDSGLSDGECFASGDTIGCVDTAFDQASLTRLWISPSTLLLDGTYRHVVPPAWDGVNTYVVESGISTYEMRSEETRTGRFRFVTPLAYSTIGQKDRRSLLEHTPQRRRAPGSAPGLPLRWNGRVELPRRAYRSRSDREQPR
jgi:hypothetical protein